MFYVISVLGHSQSVIGSTWSLKFRQTEFSSPSSPTKTPEMQIFIIDIRVLDGDSGWESTMELTLNNS